MPETLTFLGRPTHKLLPCGVSIDPDSCPCPNVEIIVSSSSEEESVGTGEPEDTFASSCPSLNKLSKDDIEISIYLDRVFSIFRKTLKKLELSASLQALLFRPELSNILNKEDFKAVINAFEQYVRIEPCNWPCSRSPEASESTEKSSMKACSSTNLGNFDNPKIYEAIEILNNYKEVRETAKHLRQEYSEPAQLFLGYMKYFIEHSLKRIQMSPIESRERDLRYRKLWRDNEEAKMNLKKLTVALDEQRRKHDIQMRLINSQCEKESATVKRVNKKCKEDIKYTVIKSERKMMMMYKASEIKQKEIREDVSDAESHLKTIRAFNIALEKEARDKRFKIESQLLGIINKYDNEIGEQQKQMENLIAEFERDKKIKHDLEEEIDKQSEIYDSLMKEKRAISEAIINEKLAKIMLLRVVKIIQRWWRGVREKRKANIVKTKMKKKSAKNKKKK